MFNFKISLTDTVCFAAPCVFQALCTDVFVRYQWMGRWVCIYPQSLLPQLTGSYLVIHCWEKVLSRMQDQFMHSLYSPSEQENSIVRWIRPYLRQPVDLFTSHVERIDQAFSSKMEITTYREFRERFSHGDQFFPVSRWEWYRFQLPKQINQLFLNTGAIALTYRLATVAGVSLGFVPATSLTLISLRLMLAAFLSLNEARYRLINLACDIRDDYPDRWPDQLLDRQFLEMELNFRGVDPWIWDPARASLT